ADNSGGHRLTAVEDFDVDPLRRHTHGRERLGHFRHEATWPTQVDFRLTRHAGFVESGSRQMTGTIEILAHPLVQSWLAVTHVIASVRKRAHEVADFSGKRVMPAITCGMDPEDLPCRAVSRQGVQHRQNRCHSDPSADQRDRSLSRLQNETSARRADVESVAHTDMLPQVAPSHTIRLDLHTNSITLRRERARKGVAAK